ncbi:bacterial Ig-like domain-containing protein, partial [Faecalimonas sp.]
KVSKEFSITKTPKQISSIFVKENPKKNYLVGEKFSPSGLVLTLVYNDKTEEEVAYSEATAKDFAFTPTLDKSLTETDKQVTVTYAGKSVKIDITVSPASKPNPEKPNKPNADKIEGNTSNSGQQHNTTTSSHPVKTGDSANVVIPITMMVVAIFGIGAVVIFKRKRK